MSGPLKSWPPACFLIFYSTVQYSIVQYSTVQYSTVRNLFFKCSGHTVQYGIMLLDGKHKMPGDRHKLTGDRHKLPGDRHKLPGDSHKLTGDR